MDSPILLDIVDFDVIVFGTGLLESLLSSCLAKKGQKVLVLDIDKAYSGSMQSLNLKEFLSFFLTQKENEQTKILKKSIVFSDFWNDDTIFDIADFQSNPNKYQYKSYNIDLQPRLLYSKSITVDIMRDADMDRYMEFGAIKQLLCIFNNEFIQPPFSKGEIFKHTQLSALEKRNLFKLLQNFLSHFHTKLNLQIDPNSTKEFDKTISVDEKFLLAYQKYSESNCLLFLKEMNISPKLQELLIYALILEEKKIDESFEEKESLLTTEQFFGKLFKFIKSLGIHTELPFLYPHYGIGDIPQAFARIAAVYGSIFIINDKVKVTGIKMENEKLNIYSDIAGEKQYLTAKKIIFASEYRESLKEILSFDSQSDHLSLLKEKLNNAEDYQYLLRGTIILTAKENEEKEGEEEKNEILINLKAPSVLAIPPNQPDLLNANPIRILVLNHLTSSTPSKKFLVQWSYVLTKEEYENKNIFSQFAKKVAVLLLAQNLFKNFELTMNMSYIQRKNKKVDVIFENDIFIAKDGNFDLDLDEDFESFETHIHKFGVELKEGEKYFGLEKKEEEEKEEQENELEKLVKNLDQIVTSSNEKNEENNESLNAEKPEEKD